MSRVIPVDDGVVEVDKPAVQAQNQNGQASRDNIQIGTWSNSLSDCCSSCVPNCLMSTFCPCISVAQIYARMGIISYGVAMGTAIVVVIVCVVICAANGEAGGGLVLAFLFGDAMLTPLVWHLRMQVRGRFKIGSSCCEDWYVASTWNCCAIAQMASHTRSYSPGDCSFRGPSALPPYQH